jgi:hypothetical protein
LVSILYLWTHILRVTSIYLPQAQLPENEETAFGRSRKGQRSLAGQETSKIGNFDPKPSDRRCFESQWWRRPMSIQRLDLWLVSSASSLTKGWSCQILGLSQWVARTRTNHWQNTGVGRKTANCPSAIRIYCLNPRQYFLQHRHRSRLNVPKLCQLRLRLFYLRPRPTNHRQFFPKSRRS